MSKNGMLRPVRHWIVRRIAPNIWKNAQKGGIPLGGVPRPMIGFCAGYFGDQKIIGAEIGVAEGFNAKSILREINIERLYLVDPYLPYVEDARYEPSEIYDRSAGFRQAKNQLDPEKVIWINQTSEKALPFIPSNLDFCYIDGNHSYEFVRQDIENYYPKIKPGGVIGGHDFWGDYTGLIRAVIEFADKEDLRIFSKLADWWIIKK